MNRKTAVITGASSGIGMELAPLFAAHGYDLILVARRGERLRKLADDLVKVYAITAHAIPMDLAQPAAGEKLWRAISAVAPDIDVLVNNAGVGDSGDFAVEVPEVIERMIHLNVSTLTSLTRHALTGMVARKHGKILNVASLAGFQPGGPGMAAYYASKSYVLSFSRGIRRELRGSGVTVTTLCPGPTRTEFEETAKAQKTWLFRWSKPMEARDVARAGFDAMQRGRAVVVPGLLNKLLAFSPRFGPAAIALEINRILLAQRR
ncbi:MAG: SDR family oxidoreductase [Nitrosomonadales bacterium]|nr:SDR family oxidoreductase [Nitrosomonadales bacterium]